MEKLKAPFPYFGGKSKVADIIWQRFGNVKNYVEPFFGSGAVLLGRPNFDYSKPPNEFVNDLDGMICNFWRAISKEPERVAEYALWPCIENDLHARHCWLLGQKELLTARLEGNPDFYDAKIAGWWVWGICTCIGRSWCAGDGPWVSENGFLVKRMNGANRAIPRLTADVGVCKTKNINDWFNSLQARLKKVHICCGDFARILKPSIISSNDLSGIFLDPPYKISANRDKKLYAEENGDDPAERAYKYAMENGDNPMLRIALCGYEGEHDMPKSWECYHWKATGGFGNQRKDGQNENRHRERIWFSPHCLKDDLFGALEEE